MLSCMDVGRPAQMADPWTTPRVSGLHARSSHWPPSSLWSGEWSCRRLGLELLMSRCLCLHGSQCLCCFDCFLKWSTDSVLRGRAVRSDLDMNAHSFPFPLLPPFLPLLSVHCLRTFKNPLLHLMQYREEKAWDWHPPPASHAGVGSVCCQLCGTVTATPACPWMGLFEKRNRDTPLLPRPLPCL